MSAYRTPRRPPNRDDEERLPATGGVTLWHLLEFMSIVCAPSMAIGVAKGGGLTRVAIAVAIGLLFGLPCPIIIHKVGRLAFNAGVHPLPMYAAAVLFPFAWGVLAMVITRCVLGAV